MRCVEFHREPYGDEIRCTVELTTDELTILSNALYYYCNESDGKDELSTNILHREIYGINSFIRSGVHYDDGGISSLDKKVNALRKKEKGL